MACVHVVVDGATALPRDAALNFGITIVPQTVASGHARWEVGADFSAEQFWPQVGVPHQLLSTPPAPVAAYRAAFETVLDWGVEIISLHPPAHLAASAGAARAALAQLPANVPISVIETPWIATALGLLAIQTAHDGSEGAPRTVLEANIAAASANMHLVFVSTRSPAELLAAADTDPSDVANTTDANDVADATEDDEVAAEDEVADDLDCSAVDRTTAVDGGRQALGSEGDSLWLYEMVAGNIEARVPCPNVGAALRAVVNAVQVALTAPVALADDGRGVLHMAIFSANADAEAAAVATFLETRYGPSEMWLAPCDPVLGALLGGRGFGAAFHLT